MSANNQVFVKQAAKTAMDELGKKGEFIRTASTFRSWVKKDGSTKYEPADGRYALIVSYACPWACRTLMTRALKGLENHIEVHVVDPVFQKTREDPKDTHMGWFFQKGDQFLGHKHVRDLYESVDKSANKFTVPILFDLKNEEIVNNESSEIIRMFSTEFDDLATRNVDFNIYPEHLQKEIDAVNDWVYPMINNGVYRAGFARTQEAYNEAVEEVFEGLEKAEEILSKQRYLVGSTFTEADIRLFVTLVRFDDVYVSHFKCLRARVRDYPNLRNYLREIYQLKGMSDTVQMDHIKNHYYMSHPTINPLGIVPVSQDTIGDLKLPHDRERFPSDTKLE